MKKYLIKTTLFCVLVILFEACKKDSTPPTSSDSASTTGKFILHLHTHIDITEVEAYDSLYPMFDTRKMSVHLAQMFFSEVQLVKLDGTTIDVTSNSFLKTFENEQYIIGNVPVGNYKGVRFKVGLNPTKNALDPITSSESTILNNSEMWFGNSAQPDGYVFFNLQGTIDTTTAMNGTPVNFEYRIGTNANYISVVLPEQNFTVIKDMNSFAHVIIDYSKIFDGIILNDASNLSIHSVNDNNLPIVTTLKNNISSMFHYE
ncbi:MAG: hypothetical protein LW701_10005 [Fluviicola sp.]|jgi:hypothetical protein|nr:hypothetical protein [Fluviicola sp.]